VELQKENPVAPIGRQHSNVVSVFMPVQEVPAVDKRQETIDHFLSKGVYIAPPDERAHIWAIQCRGRGITDGDIARLKSLGDELEVLGLEGAEITDGALGHLVGFSVLNNVDLTSTGVTDVGMRHLAEIRTLEHVLVEGTRVTRKGIAIFREAVPRCGIAWDEGFIEGP
jgi:hypothetical protein